MNPWLIFCFGSAQRPLTPILGTTPFVGTTSFVGTTHFVRTAGVTYVQDERFP